MLDDMTGLIANRADENGGPVRAAILAASPDFRVVVGAVFERRFEARQRVRIGVLRDQGVETLPQHLLLVISGESEKAVIGKNYWMVGFLCVCKNHRRPRCFSGDYKRTEVFPKVLDFLFRTLLIYGLILCFRHKVAP